MKMLKDYKTADGVPISEIDAAVFLVQGDAVQRWLVRGVRYTPQHAPNALDLILSPSEGATHSYVACWRVYASEAKAIECIIKATHENANSTVLRLTRRLAEIGGES